MTRASQNSNALPVYIQISELLIRDIAAGRLMDGERLPPEREMAADLGTSVGTLRKALAVLVDKGLLERVQGSGNYIRQKAQFDSVYAMFRLELLAGGGLPRADVLDVTYLEKPDDLAPFGSSDMASRIRRVRYLNDTVIALEEIWLDGSVGKVVQDELSESLYHYYQKQLGFWISRAEDRVGIGAVPAWTSEMFSKPSGELVGYVERMSWADAATPIEFSKTWFDTDKALYVQRLK
ncbi:GntR family transcriptional regulator [Roseibium algae]|uniref:GntR family transcriptional regulator n=1 Tax=Roseibium algae TaxID=3123038 RepID=A0ABU8TKE9_9HYPH